MPNISKARSLRQSQTWAEKALWKLLRDRRFAGYKFRRQHPADGYVLDFYCSSAKLAIELDGNGHGHPAHKKEDEQRDAILLFKGIKVLRFWNRDLKNNERMVRDSILRELELRDPPKERKVI